MTNINFSYSSQFLEALDSEKSSYTYAKAILLDKNNTPLDTIQGIIQSGSINIDGNSTMRRTCSLSILSQEEDINSFNWVFKNRIQLYLGKRNTLKRSFPEYSDEDIIWFNQGYFIITDFNSSITVSGMSINIVGKDKMCLLNGEVEGIIEAQTIFSEKEIVKIDKIPAGIGNAFGYKRDKFYVYRNGHATEMVLRAGQKKIIAGYDGELLSYSAYLPNGEEVWLDSAIDEKNHQVMFKIRKAYSKNINLTVLYQQYIEFTSDIKSQECPTEILSYAILYGPDKESIQTVELSNFTYNINTKTFNYNGNTIPDGYFIRAYYEYEGYVKCKDRFNPYETYYTDQEDITKKLVPIREIIMGLMTEYAHEKPQNIIINDLDDYGLKLMQYVGDSDFYAMKEVGSNVYNQVTFDAGLTTDDGKRIDSLTAYNELGDGFITPKDSGEIITINEKQYTVAKISYGQRAGYNLTDLVYSGELIANAGDTITSVLDKIISMLTEFEYFYDENGRFIFQKKKIYASCIPLFNGENTKISLADWQPYSYQFKNNIISSIQNNPNLSNIFNDYVIWGERQGIETSIPIHIRYAIASKPVCYKTLELTKEDAEMYKQLTGFEGEITNYIKDSEFFYTEDFHGKTSGGTKVDWREIIYQMANDFFKAHYFDDFEWRLHNTNKDYEGVIVNGRTGYEDYYRDVFGFWRQLYSLKQEQQYRQITFGLSSESDLEDKKIYKIYVDGKIVGTPSSESKIGNGSKVYSTGELDLYALSSIDGEYVKIIGSGTEKYGNYWYYPVETNEVQYAPNIYYIRREEGESHAYKLSSAENYSSSTNYYERFQEFYTKEDVYDGEPGWRKDITTNPESLNFWIDFADGNPEIMEYSVQKIGSKKKVANNNKAGIIYETEPPTLIYITSDEKKDTTKTGYTYINLDPISKTYFNISRDDLSVYDVLNQNLQNYVYARNSISITSLPVYYLQPNTKITIDNKNLKTSGDYILERISYSFGNANSMSLSATLIPPRVI